MFEAFQLSSSDWILLFMCSLFVGMSKAGVPGISMVVVPIIAMLFGGKQSTGVLLPLLIMADVFGVSYYHRHANWKHILKALPWAIVGVVLAMFVGNMVNDNQFKQIIAVVIFTSIAIMIWRDKTKTDKQIPNKWLFAALMGLGGGFATMIGNAAGPVFAIYLLALHLPKKEFIGTAAWFFFIINLIKFPLHVFIWKTINVGTLLLNISTLPLIALGVVIGIVIVKKIPSNVYRWVVIAVTVLSAFMMLI